MSRGGYAIVSSSLLVEDKIKNGLVLFSLILDVHLANFP